MSEKDYEDYEIAGDLSKLCTVDEEGVENVPCVSCGRKDLPLFTDYTCPECHKEEVESK